MDNAPGAVPMDYAPGAVPQGQCPWAVPKGNAHGQCPLALPMGSAAPGAGGADEETRGRAEAHAAAGGAGNGQQKGARLAGTNLGPACLVDPLRKK